MWSFKEENTGRRKEFLLNRLRKINKEIVDDYDSVYGNYDEYYDDEAEYGHNFGRQIYDVSPEVNKDFETYKNMFDFENSQQSQEHIDQKIDGFTDWFKNSEFGEDLNLPRNRRFDGDRSATNRLSRFKGRQRIPQKSFGNCILLLYKFGIFQKYIKVRKLFGKIDP